MSRHVITLNKDEADPKRSIIWGSNLKRVHWQRKGHYRICEVRAMSLSLILHTPTSTPILVTELQRSGIKEEGILRRGRDSFIIGCMKAVKMRQS
uniref:Uncharacterized protein n=1 Tax=Timema tahoe TaxID=61484 RepID=A0A7R9IGP7_9NEOP|nr:unnamed protein product [Timema tahoe]